MSKMHFKIFGIDCRIMGQTEFEYTHQSACGYVRNNVTRNADDVNCKFCLRSEHMSDYLAVEMNNLTPL